MSKQTSGDQKTSSTDAAKPKPVQVAFYQLGIRCQQAKKLFVYARQSDFCPSVAHAFWLALQRLETAVEMLNGNLSLGTRRSQIADLLYGLVSNTVALEKLDGDTLGCSGDIEFMERGTTKVIVLCREAILSHKDVPGQLLGTWFETGIEITNVWYYEGCERQLLQPDQPRVRPTTSFTPPFSKGVRRSFYKDFAWENPSKLLSHLSLLGLTIDQLFPRVEKVLLGGSKHNAEGLPNEFLIWNCISAGLQRLAESAASRAASTKAASAHPSKTRPSFYRGQYWLHLRETKFADSSKPWKGIRDEWDGMSEADRKQICPEHPHETSGGENGIQTVKKQVKIAKKERDELGVRPSFRSP